MSRKREEKREQKRELARQLGVSGKQVPQNLIENERVTEPSWKATVTADVVKRAFLFGKDIPFTIVCALWIVDPSGARAVRDLVITGDAARAGEVVCLCVDDGDDVVRYRRPGRFVIAAELCGATPDDSKVFDASVVDKPPAGVVTLAIPVVDRVKETFALKLASPDGKLALTLSLAVRL